MSNTVEELLNKEGIPYSISGKDCVTKCFNPEHEDTHPSFRIDRITGIAHCFSCGYKLNLFKHFGILTLSNSIKVAKLKEKLTNLKTSLFGIEKPKGLMDYAKSFREISISTLAKFEACYTDSVQELQDRIMFPIKDANDRVVSYVCRHTLSDQHPKYVNYPAGAKMPLFPAKPEKPSHTLVLVEGLFDFLNLYDRGIHNVACCFGTNTIKSNLKEKLLPYKAAGLEKVYILFDGDEAGSKGAEDLKPLIEHLEISVEVLDLPDGVDPGTLAQEDIDSIKEYIK